MSDDEDEKVGYGKPPKHTRFKKGQSGNPKGRAKGTRNFKTDLREELESAMEVTIDGRKRKLSKQRIFVKRLINDSIKGGSRSEANLLKALKDANLIHHEDQGDQPLSVDELALLQRYADRARQQRSPDPDLPATSEPDSPPAAAPAEPAPASAATPEPRASKSDSPPALQVITGGAGPSVAPSVRKREREWGVYLQKPGKLK